MIKAFITSFSLILVTGCAGIPLTSVYKMMTANPLDFDPQAVSVAIKRSDAIEINTGHVEMGVFINNNNPDLKISQKYYLVVDNKPENLVLDQKLNTNEALSVLTLSPEDVINMQNLQKAMKVHLKNGGDSDDFGFYIRVVEGCRHTNKLPENILLSLFLKLDFNTGYFPLYEDFNLSKADLKPLKNLEDWEMCVKENNQHSVN